jgi:uncharacterized protein DUF222
VRRCAGGSRRWSYALINSVAREATPEELGGKLSHAIAEASLISRAEASRRISSAADLGARCGLTGEPLPPVLAATAAAQRDGTLGAEQVAVIRCLYHQPPGWVDHATREQVEARLAKEGNRFAPNNSPSWPPRWPTASIPTAPIPTRIGRAGAA